MNIRNKITNAFAALCAAAFLCVCLSGCSGEKDAKAKMKAEFQLLKVGMSYPEAHKALYGKDAPSDRSRGSYLSVVKDKYGHEISLLVEGDIVTKLSQKGLD